MLDVAALPEALSAASNYKRNALGQRCTASGKSIGHGCESLECREPVLKFSPEVNKQIGIDVTEFKGGRYKHFDDLLDGIFCAYLAYYFWYWGEDGCWVVGDLETGCVTLPRCRLSNCPLHANAMLASAAPE